MRTLLLTILFITLMSVLSAQSFITTWKTDNPGTSNSTSITIPTNPSYTYLYDVDWNNDGVFDQFGITGDVTHDFGTSGTYTIALQGTFPAISFNYGGDAEKILSVNQWGNIAWKDMTGAFWGAKNLSIIASDVPDLSNVTSLRSMFQFATNFTGDLSNWDVSNIYEMDLMFSGAASFNSDLSNWDISNVGFATQMFSFATSFNSDLSNWNTSNMFMMFNMFRNASSVDFNLGSWDLSNIVLMDNMLQFSGISVVNYDNTLIGWDNQGFTNKNLGNTGGLIYCNSQTARANLIAKGWTITGDVFDCSNVPLPVELLNFNANSLNNRVTSIYWQTTSETNNSGFEIQRSKDGEDWQTLAFVEGKGTTSEKQSYEYVDRSPEMGVNYYRLNQLDHDGASSYSDVVAVALKSAGLAQAFYPNPAKDFIFFPNVEEGVLRLTDITGKEVARIRFSNSNADVSMLPSGTYYGTFVDGLMYKPMLIVKE